MSCPDSLPITAGALASAIAQICTDEELDLLSALFSQLGDSLELILAAKSNCAGISSSSTVSGSD